MEKFYWITLMIILAKILLLKGINVNVMLTIIEWTLFFIFEAYILHNEKRKMYLYEIWMEH